MTSPTLFMTSFIVSGAENGLVSHSNAISYIHIGGEDVKRK